MGFEPITSKNWWHWPIPNPERQHEPAPEPTVKVIGSFGDGGKKTGQTLRKYRPAAQLFKDEDLRLGIAGRLGG
jgi:hypothetical protein